MRSFIGPAMLGIGTILVSSMFAVLKSLDRVDPIVRASWRLQTTFLALSVPSILSIYISGDRCKIPHRKDNRRVLIFPPVATIWSGCGYALYNVGLCTALAKTSLLRASILSQCAPLFIVLYKILRNICCYSRGIEYGVRQDGVYWKHLLGVLLTLVGTGAFVSFTAESQSEKNNYQGSALEISSRSQVIGDLAAAAASMGYATYISCGQKARRSVPVYIHLPVCVLVATILVSMFCIMAVNVSNPRSITLSTNDKSNFDGGETIGFCSYVLGWTCPQYLPRIAYLGIVCGAIAVGLINWSLNHVSALQAAAANSAEPIAASIIGIVVFSEPVPNFVALVAAIVIIFGMLLCSADDERDKIIEKKDASNGKKRMLQFGAVQFTLLKGLIVFSLVVMECFHIYYSQKHLPKIPNHISRSK